MQITKTEPHDQREELAVVFQQLLVCYNSYLYNLTALVMTVADMKPV